VWAVVVYAYRRVLVRLSVIEAAGLRLISDREPRDRDDYAALQAGRPMGISGSTKSQLKSMANMARAKSPERPLDCHSFVAVILQKPRPGMSVLIGHTNTEYGTQNPVYGANANLKVREEHYSQTCP